MAIVHALPVAAVMGETSLGLLGPGTRGHFYSTIEPAKTWGSIGF